MALAAIRKRTTTVAGIVTLSCIPGIAHAQHIPLWLVAAALSPLLVIVLAIVLGFLTRSWRVGVAHTGLVLVWVLLFALAAYFVENDYVIWTPIVLFAVHSLLILVLIIIHIVKPARTAEPTN